MTDAIPKHPGGRPPERIMVTVRRRERGGHIDEDVVWPKNWPLPGAGSTVAAGPLSGFVEYVEFDVDAQRILIVLR